jgi:hypothetical protein
MVRQPQVKRRTEAVVYVIRLGFHLLAVSVEITVILLPESLFSLFLSPSIREYIERSSQASRHPLRNAPKNA